MKEIENEKLEYSGKGVEEVILTTVRSTYELLWSKGIDVDIDITRDELSDLRRRVSSKIFELDSKRKYRVQHKLYSFVKSFVVKYGVTDKDNVRLVYLAFLNFARLTDDDLSFEEFSGAFMQVIVLRKRQRAKDLLKNRVTVELPKEEEELLYKDELRRGILSTIDVLGYAPTVGDGQKSTYMQKGCFYSRFLEHTGRDACDISTRMISRLMAEMGVRDVRKSSSLHWVFGKKQE